MNKIDLIVGGLLLLSLISGWRAGFVQQVLGLAGFLAAVWLAIRYGDAVGSLLHVEPSAAAAAGFLTVLLVVGLASVIATWGVRKLFHFAGFGIPDQILGAVVALLKTTLLLGGLLWAAEHIDLHHKLLSPQTINESKSYKPLSAVAQALYPLLQQAEEQVPSPHADE